MFTQVRRGDLLPATILTVYVGAGIAIYFFYGLRHSRRMGLAGEGSVA
jgi:APA family basic amino acid/polyamine antiporter